jgi:ribosome-binding factor A
MKKPSYRQERVAMLINAALLEALQRGKLLDKRLVDCPLTITEVKVSADLKIANCYFVPFNTNFSAAELEEALYNSRYAIREYVTKKVNLKFSTEIRFYCDKGFENARKVEELLKSCGR